ncbi:MAG: ABC transporter ATP-binding protein [Alphaproteobacteria bacterium]|nr:ABC transporter ATP-binding protein [Alphaproteobacteria bacterium]
MTNILEVKNITLDYGRVRALRNVSLSVGEGETVALIGTNGAGKSSTLRAITGLRPIAGGEIYFRGEKINGIKAEQLVKKGIVMVPEGRHVFPFMSVRDNLLMGAFIHHDKKMVEADLEKVLAKFPRLKERFRQQASTMSGGEQQMLVIGRALMTRPSLLLLDEPSLGIAPKLVQDIARSIVAINREDKVSVILVEQNSQLAMRISHRTYLLSTGQVALSGASSKLQNDPNIKKMYLGG